MSAESGEGVTEYRSRHAAPDSDPGMPSVRSRRRAAERRHQSRMLPSGFSSIRDVLSFIAGIVIIGNEVFFQDAVEIALLTVGVALLGLPVVFGADEKRNHPPADPAP